MSTNDMMKEALEQVETKKVKVSFCRSCGIVSKAKDEAECDNCGFQFDTDSARITGEFEHHDAIRLLEI